MTHDVFISFARGDRELVASIARRLEERGLSTWYDASIEPGPDWSDQLAGAVAGAGLVAVFYSAEADQSRSVRRAVAHADALGKPIVPVLIENVEPRGDLLHALTDRAWVGAQPDPRAHADAIAAHIAQCVANPSDSDLRAPVNGKAARRMSRFKRRALSTATLGAYGAMARRRAIRSFRSSLRKL